MPFTRKAFIAANLPATPCEALLAGSLSHSSSSPIPRPLPSASLPAWIKQRRMPHPHHTRRITAILALHEKQDAQNGASV